MKSAIRIIRAMLPDRPTRYHLEAAEWLRQEEEKRRRKGFIYFDPKRETKLTGLTK